MKKIVSLLLFLSVLPLALSAQDRKIYVKSFDADILELRAKTDPVYDKNKIPASMVSIFLFMGWGKNYFTGCVMLAVLAALAISLRTFSVGKASRVVALVASRASEVIRQALGLGRIQAR